MRYYAVADLPKENVIGSVSLWGMFLSEGAARDFSIQRGGGCEVFELIWIPNNRSKTVLKLLISESDIRSGRTVSLDDAEQLLNKKRRNAE